MRNCFEILSLLVFIVFHCYLVCQFLYVLFLISINSNIFLVSFAYVLINQLTKISSVWRIVMCPIICNYWNIFFLVSSREKLIPLINLALVCDSNASAFLFSYCFLCLLFVISSLFFRIFHFKIINSIILVHNQRGHFSFENYSH